MSNILGLARERMEQVAHEASTALGPLHAAITRVLIEQEDNSVISLSHEEFALEANVLQFGHGILDRMPLDFWGLRLKLAPCIAKGVDKTWIKKSYIWTRMLEAAGEETEVGFKEPGEPTERLFRLASLSQIPRQEFDGQEVLLCAVGSNARTALLTVLVTHENFNSADWDADGYYLGPADGYYLGPFE